MPKQGDIVLIPIPFTDLSSTKQRPVIVVSNDAYNRHSADVVVVAMTSNPTPGPYTFVLTSANLERGRLNRPGQVRVDKVYALSQALIVKTFGRVDAATLNRIHEQLHDLTVRQP